MKRTILSLLFLFAFIVAGHAQTQISSTGPFAPTHFVEGSGTPTGTCNTSYNYGLIYLDHTGLNLWTCAAGGWTEVGASGGGGISGGTATFIPQFTAGGTGISNTGLFVDSSGNNLTVPGNLFTANATLTNAGSFATTSAIISYDNIAVGGCSANTDYHTVQFQYNMTAALSICNHNTGTTGNNIPVAIFATSSENVPNVDANVAQFYGFATTNNGHINVSNPVAQDIVGLTTGVQMTAEELDLQVYNGPSAYSAGDGLRITLGDYSSGNPGGNYPFNAIHINANNVGGAMAVPLWNRAMSVDPGAINGSVFYIRENGTATSATNFGGPIVDRLFDSWWNGTVAATVDWDEQLRWSANGSNPANDQLYWSVNNGSYTGNHYFTLASYQGMNFAFQQSGGGLEVFGIPKTQNSAGTFYLPPYVGVMTADGWPSAPAAVNCLPAATSTTAYTLACSEMIDAGAGVTIGSPTGGAQGVNTLNASGLYVNGVAVGTGGSSAWSGITAGSNTATGSFSTAASWTYSAGGAASTSVMSLIGAPYTAGTATTNFPLFYLNDGAATTTLSTAGTEFGINAPSGFTGMTIDSRVNGAATAAFSVDYLGNVIGRSFNVGNVLSVGNGIAANAAGTQLAIQGGQDTTTTNPGGLTLRGSNIASGGNAASSVSINAGQSQGSGTQGGVQVNMSYKTTTALAATFELVSVTGTDQVGATVVGGVNVVGVAQTVGGTGTAIYVATEGKTSLRFDGTPVIGDLACAPPTSTGTAGLAHDNGSATCPSGQGLGIVTGQVSGTGSGATANVLLEIGGGSGDFITSPNSTLTVAGTPASTTLDINLANANTWTGVQTFSAGITAGSGAVAGELILPFGTGPGSVPSVSTTLVAAASGTASEIVLPSAPPAGSNYSLIGNNSSGVVTTTWTATPSSVTNSDSTLTISPTTGAVVASLNTAHANTWTAAEINSTAGAASTPALDITGAPFAGTASNSFGQLLLNWNTGTLPSTMNTSGTGFMEIAPSGFAGFLQEGFTGTGIAYSISAAGAIFSNSTITANSGFSTGGAYTATSGSTSSFSANGGGGLALATSSNATSGACSNAGVLSWSQRYWNGTVGTNSNSTTITPTCATGTNGALTYTWASSVLPMNVVLSGALTANSIVAQASRKGTFVCTAAGTITISNTNEALTSDVIISLNTAGGTITTAPAMKTVTAGTGFTALCGASDTSTYNYDILN